MKRIIYFLLLFVFILSLSSCGITEEEYTYNYLPVAFPQIHSFGSFQSQSIENGAILSLPDTDLNGEMYKEGEGYQPLNCLFNEETKVLIPLCFNVSCSHETPECFACGVYQRDFFGNRGIYKDKLFTTKVVSEGMAGEETSYIHVEYYSLDGTLIDSEKHEIELIRTDGERALGYGISSMHLQYGNKRYYHANQVADYNVPYNERYTENWVIVHDLEANTFTSYTLPRTKFGVTVNFKGVSERGLGCNYNEIGCILNFETGEVTEYDCAEILDRLIAKDSFLRNFEIVGIDALNDYFVLTMGKGKMYVRISTEEAFIPTDVENYCVIGNPWRFEYNGDMYFLGEEYDDNRSDYINLQTGGKFTIIDEERYYTIYSETENGLILAYVNILPDGTREPTYEIRKEGGREVQYTFPKKLAYVTKEDFLDGSVDEPWFYDPETYSFVQR